MVGWKWFTPTRSTDGKAGFTLLEVLIAFVIMTIVLAALYRGFAGGLRGLDTSEGYALAAMQAQSKLDEVGTAIPLEAGVTSGEFDDGMTWELTVDPFEIAGVTEADDLPVGGYRVVLEVTWEETRNLRFETLRLGEAE